MSLASRRSSSQDVAAQAHVSGDWSGQYAGELPCNWKPLGNGSSGVVYVAKRLSTDECEAVKVIQEPEADPIADATAVAGGESTAWEKMFEEVCILQCLSHPHIVDFRGAWFPAPVLDSGDNKTAMWIGMEHCAAGTVESLAPLEDEQQLRYVCCCVVKALEYMHRVKGVIHRDVRAANIFCCQSGVVKLGDFGVAVRLNDTPDGRRGSTIGTPHWMAPEVILDGRRYDGRCDVWSLGVTAIESADGEPPMFSSSALLAMFQIPRLPPATLMEERLTHEGLVLFQGSPECRDFIARCMTKDLDARPQSWELLSDPFVATDPGPEPMLAAVRTARERPVYPVPPPVAKVPQVQPRALLCAPGVKKKDDSDSEDSNGTFVENISEYSVAQHTGGHSDGDDALNASRKSRRSILSRSDDSSSSGGDTFVERDDVSDVGTTDFTIRSCGGSVAGGASTAGRCSPAAPPESPRITAGEGSNRDEDDFARDMFNRGPRDSQRFSGDWSRRRSVIDAVLWSPPASPAGAAPQRPRHQRTKGFDATFFSSLDHCLEGLLPDLEPEPVVEPLAAEDAAALRQAARILGLAALPRTKQALKDAYHSAAKEWHPDRCRSDKAEENFKRVQAAYQQLQLYV
eukprot:TRINITY_DN2433_c3_g1_i1.p1 TRINITY_DN2433_c3_g1~~TRINITY_DN2433_c3_g1_i1.p1  ORF type:complete len:629 (+),score=80.25 TRINITY_DN2433_c3_g1_i1:139-2025(+)